MALADPGVDEDGVFDAEVIAFPTPPPQPITWFALPENETPGASLPQGVLTERRRSLGRTNPLVTARIPDVRKEDTLPPPAAVAAVV